MNPIKIISSIIWDSIVSKFLPRRFNARIGKYTYGNPKIVTTHDGQVIIGKYCSIADDVLIVGDNHSFRRVANFPLPWWIENIKGVPFQPPKDFSFEKGVPIVIGNDVWIGAGAIILPKVRIGNGAIIGAGAVVTHDVPPYAIVTGVPARILRFQFSRDQIEQLESIAWWNWSDEKIVKNIDRFYSDIDSFIQEFGAK